MLPGSSSASLSSTRGGSLNPITHTPGDQPLTPALPPSAPVLQSVTTPIPSASSPRAASLSGLPTVVVYLVKSCLADKDTLQLIMSSQHLKGELQGFYKSRLRSTVADHCASPIARYQHPIFRKPEYVPMGAHGEAIFQACMRLRATGMLSEDDYCLSVVQAYRARQLPLTDTRQLSDLSTGAGLALGGKLMTAAHWLALLKIFVSADKPEKEQCKRILNAVYGLCLAHGGAEITPVNCTAITKILLNIYRANYQFGSQFKFPLNELMIGLFHGLGGSAMSRANTETLVEQFAAHAETFGIHEMGKMTGTFCTVMGGVAISAQCRDTILVKILSPCTTTVSGLAHVMTASVVQAMGGMPPRPASITPENLDAVISQVLMAHGTSDGLIYSVYAALRREYMTPVHRLSLTTHILQSDRRHDIIEALKKSPDGKQVVRFLQLEKQ